MTATLGEVKNRADLILFWGVDPITTHPRHAERYSIDAVGRFRPGGRADRTILVVDETPTPTSKLAELLLTVPADRELEAIWTMHALLAGRLLDGVRVLAATGRPIDEWKRLVERLRRAEYAVIFADATYRSSRRSLAVLEAMACFVRELNNLTRCVLLPLGGPGNQAGAESILSWQTGFSNAADLGSGAPSSLPGVSSIVDRLCRREVDLALIVADAFPEDLPPAALRHLKEIPQIVVSPATVAYDFEPTVRFTPGNPLLTSDGSVIRCDGVPLPLRSPIAFTSPSDRDCLRAISSMLGEIVHSSELRA